MHVTGHIAGVEVQNCKGLSEGNKPATGKLYTDVVVSGMCGRLPYCYSSALGIIIITVCRARTDVHDAS